MSVVSIKTYFVTRMESIGYTEHDSPRFDNVPENKLNKSFHIEIGDITNSQQDQRTMTLSCPVTVRAFYKNSNSQSARDKAITGLDAILNDLCAAENRIALNVKNVLFRSARRESVSETNDKDQVLVCDFSAQVIYIT